MWQFEYTARNHHGETVQGFMVTLSIYDVLEMIMEQDLIVEKIDQLTPMGDRQTVFSLPPQTRWGRFCEETFVLLVVVFFFFIQFLIAVSLVFLAGWPHWAAAISGIVLTHVVLLLTLGWIKKRTRQLLASDHENFRAD